MTAQDIGALWDEHKNTPFPADAYGVEVDGTDLVLLDADTSGCVSYFLVSRRLDDGRRGILQTCERKRRAIVPKLGPQTRPYFEGLALLATAVLERTPTRHARKTVDESRGYQDIDPERAW